MVRPLSRHRRSDARRRGAAAERAAASADDRRCAGLHLELHCLEASRPTSTSDTRTTSASLSRASNSLQEQLRAIIHPDDFAEMHRTLSNCFQTGEPFLMRYRRRGKDGIYRWTEGRAEPLRDQDGAIVQWYGVSLDIEDERRRAGGVAASLRQARPGDSGCKPCRALGFDRARGEPALAAIVANSHACQRWLDERSTEPGARTDHCRSASSGTPTQRRRSSAASAPCSDNPLSQGTPRRSLASLPKRATSWPRRLRVVASVWTRTSKATFRLSRSIASRFSRF